MGRIDLALAAVIAVSSAAPAAADQVQGTQTNKSGAARGDARSDPVHDMTKAK